jgi:hypothetical protein
MDHTCSACKHWLEGTCRESSPQFVEKTLDGSRWAWPVTRPEDTCSRWAPKVAVPFAKRSKISEEAVIEWIKDYHLDADNPPGMTRLALIKEIMMQMPVSRNAVVSRIGTLERQRVIRFVPHDEMNGEPCVQICRRDEAAAVEPVSAITPGRPKLFTDDELVGLVRAIAPTEQRGVSFRKIHRAAEAVRACSLQTIHTHVTELIGAGRLTRGDAGIWAPQPEIES